MKLIQLTDIHLTTPGQTIAGRDPNANFEKALDHALGHHPDAEAIFITGDLSDWGDAGDYQRLAARIAQLPVPVHLCIGNHDDRDTLLAVFPRLADRDGHVQQVIPLSLGTALTLDTWGPQTHAGHFCDTRAAWLAEQLEALDGPVWLFMHHNPIPLGIGPLDQIMLLDAERLERTIAPHAGKIRHIFHGHCHLPLSGSFGGIPLSAPRGTNHAGWPAFDGATFLSASDLPESYAVIRTHTRHVMVSMVEFGYAGAIRNEGSSDYATWDRATMAR